MGYRSQVAVALTDDAARLFKIIISHFPKDHEIHSLMSADQSSFNDTTLREALDDSQWVGSKIYFEDVKWYDGYSCVQVVSEFLESIPPEDFRYIRIGEESDDVEETGEFYDSDLYVARSIEGW